MTESSARRLRILFTLAVIVAEAAHLAWEYTHGGILSHHLLNRPDLPSASNAWGLLLLPVLAWVLGGLALRRALQPAPGTRMNALGLPHSLVIGFTAALAFAVALAVSFALGYANAASLLFQCMLLLAVVFPVYRAECVLGFILGMTFTFGAVLPTIIAGGLAAISAALHLLLYPLVGRIWLWLGKR